MVDRLGVRLLEHRDDLRARSRARRSEQRDVVPRAVSPSHRSRTTSSTPPYPGGGTVIQGGASMAMRSGRSPSDGVTPSTSQLLSDGVGSRDRATPNTDKAHTIGRRGHSRAHGPRTP